MLTLPEIARSRYLLHRGLCDAGFPAIRAALAVDVLLGPEPETSEDDVIGEPLQWSADPAPFEPSPLDVAWLDANPILPPISGGAPDEPDWSEYASWSAWHDA